MVNRSLQKKRINNKKKSLKKHRGGAVSYNPIDTAKSWWGSLTGRMWGKLSPELKINDLNGDQLEKVRAHLEGWFGNPKYDYIREGVEGKMWKKRFTDFNKYWKAEEEGSNNDKYKQNLIITFLNEDDLEQPVGKKKGTKHPSKGKTGEHKVQSPNNVEGLSNGDDGAEAEAKKELCSFYASITRGDRQGREEGRKQMKVLEECLDKNKLPYVSDGEIYTEQFKDEIDTLKGNELFKDQEQEIVRILEKWNTFFKSFYVVYPDLNLETDDIPPPKDYGEMTHNSFEKILQKTNETCNENE